LIEIVLVDVTLTVGQNPVYKVGRYVSALSPDLGDERRKFTCLPTISCREVLLCGIQHNAEDGCQRFGRIHGKCRHALGPNRDLTARLPKHGEIAWNCRGGLLQRITDSFLSPAAHWSPFG